MSNNNCAIVVGINEQWVFAAATLLMSIRDGNLRDIEPDVIVIHDGLAEVDQNRLREIYPCSFLEFNHPVPDNIRTSRGTHMKFSRLLCFDLLERYAKVIWLDADMLVLKPLDDLFGYGSTGIAMVSHKQTLDQIYADTCKAWNSGEEHGKYSFDVEVFNTGLMVFSDQLANPGQLKDWCLEKMVAWSAANTSIQPVMTLMFQEFNINVEELPRIYNCPLNERSDETVILHAWGNEKFWNRHYNAQWNKYYRQWRQLGGSSALVNNRLHIYAYHLIRKLKTLIRKSAGIFAH